MRSAIGPLLVLFWLATTVVLVLLLFVNLGSRSELESMRSELETIRADAADESGVSNEDLSARLDELETALDELLLAAGDGEPEATPAPGGADDGAIAARLDEIIDRLEALDDRIDEICDSVPIC